MNATITKVYGATKSEKNGQFYLAVNAQIPAQNTVLGMGSDQDALVNIALSELSEGIMSMLKQDETNPNRFTAADSEAVVDLKVTFRNFRAHAEKDNVFWATV